MPIELSFSVLNGPDSPAIVSLSSRSSLNNETVYFSQRFIISSFSNKTSPFDDRMPFATATNYYSAISQNP